MRSEFLHFGINPAGTALIARPAHMSVAPEYPLDDLYRRGMPEFCRIFGRSTLDILRIYHRAAIGHLNLFLPAGSGLVMAWPDGLPPQRADMRPTMRLRKLSVGIGDSGHSLEFQELDDTLRLSLPDYVPFAELEALGPKAGALAVGERILRKLAQLQPDAFAALLE